MTAARRRLRPVVVVVGAALVAAACGGGRGRDEEVQGDPKRSGELAAQVASYDLVAGRAGRFIVGLSAADKSRLVAFGTVEMTFTYLGPRGAARSAGAAGPTVQAGFLPIPGQHIDPAAPGPRLVEGSEAIGVYGAPAVTFDRAGFWRVAVSPTIEGRRLRAEAAFEVLERSPIPAPGDPAPRTVHPVAGAAGVDPRAIDSRAGIDAPIPDPELHSTTVAAALDAHRPVMVVVSTPTYCVSRFCGPITDSVAALARRFGDRMAFVHLEVWEDFEAKKLNPAAAAWIFPPGTEDAREPWVFTVDPQGVIVDRFDNVATDGELEAAVRRLLG